MVRKRRLLATLLAVLLSITVGSPIALGAASTAPVAGNITVTNNKEGTNDTVVVSGVVAGEIVTVYPSATSITAVANVVASADPATVTIPQLGKTAGSVYVTILSSGKTESPRTQKTYIAEPVTTAPVAANITVVNNYTGTNDSISITGLPASSAVKVYTATTGTTTVTTGTADGSGNFSASVAQLGVGAGNLYVTAMETGKHESTRTAKAYIAEPKTTAPVATNITVTNAYSGTNDTIAITGLPNGAAVKVYKASTGTTTWGTGTADSSGNASISVAQLGLTAGTVYVSAQEAGKHESARTSKAFSAEEKTVAPLAANITITNAYTGTNDTVAITGLPNGATVKVYNSATGTTTHGTGTADGSGNYSLSVAQLGATGGTIWVTAKEASKHESARTSKTFSAEEKTAAPLAANITITNAYTGTNDTVAITGLPNGAIVKVYNSATGTYECHN